MTDEYAPISSVYKNITFPVLAERKCFVWIEENAPAGVIVEYQPDECFGVDRYHPDFRITAPDGHVTYLEVKPPEKLNIPDAWRAIRAAVECDLNLYFVYDRFRGSCDCGAYVTDGALRYFAIWRECMMKMEISPEGHMRHVPLVAPPRGKVLL